MEEDRSNDLTTESSDNFSSDNHYQQSNLPMSTSLPIDYIDPPLNIQNGSTIGGYVSFSDRKSWNLTELMPSNTDDDDEDKNKKINSVKKLMFPPSVVPSLAETAEALRNERREEFSPLYPNETAKEGVRRQTKRKPVQSLLAKRIRFDDLKRQREEKEARERFVQQQYQYGPYGSASYGNPYEQMQFHNEQMAKIARVQQEHSGFWPELQQQQQQQQTYPSYPPTYSTNMNGNSSWYYSNAMYAPPPPPPPPPSSAPAPPSEPYPY